MPEPVLAADHVGVRFGAVEAVRDVSLTIAAGEIVGLVGESGSGKTTLCRALLGLQPATSGEVRLDGRPLADWPRRTLPRRVQMLLQDAVSSLSPRMRLRTLLDEPSRIHRLPRRASAAAMDRVLRQLGLPDDLLDKYPHQISGGQARRVVIARALALNPGLLVADEPTAGLDVSVQGEVLNLLLDLHRSRGLAMLIVSHNLNVVRRVTSRVAVMYLGEIVEQAPTAAMFDRPAHPYTAALLSTNPELEPGRRKTPVLLRGDIPSPANPPSGCRFHTRCPVAQPVCRQSEPQFAEVEAGRWVRCHFPYAVAGEPIALAGPVTPGAGHREC